MLVERKEIQGFGGRKLPAVVYVPDGEITVLVSVIHGMTEHFGRYEAFAERLTKEGAVVAGFDLRGHGLNADAGDTAYFGEDGWENTLKDMRIFSEFLMDTYPGIPHVMLGFSLGSFLLREYLTLHPEDADGAIVMGSGEQSALLLSVMKAIVGKEVRKAGADGTTPLIQKLSFGAYNARFRPNTTECDWLIAGEEARKYYLSDPLNKKNISAGLFYSLISAMKRTGGQNLVKNWRREMPVLLLSGAEDSVGDFSKGVNRMEERMKKAGMKRVRKTLIAGGRHVLIGDSAEGVNESCISEISAWLKEAGKYF